MASSLLPRHSPTYQLAIVAAAITLIAFVMVAGSWTWKLDQVLYDFGLNLQDHPARNDVVIVAIDEKSVADTGHWPWRRSVLATLLDRISSAGPKAVGVDILLTEPDPKHSKDDALLASALARAPHAVIPMLSVYGRQVMPTEIFAAHAVVANAAIAPDPDGVIRCANLGVSALNLQSAHMATVLAEFGGASVTNASDEMYHIPFAGPSGHVQRVSAASVLAGDFEVSAFQNKIVLVGVTAIGYADSYATPLSDRRTQMAGVEVTANIVNALLDGRQIYIVSNYTVGAVSAAAMLLLLLAFYRVGTGVSLALVILTVFATPIAAVALFCSTGIWFAPMSAAISALVAYPLWHWKRLESICFYLDEELERLERDHDHPTALLPSKTVGFADYIQNRVELIRININYLRAARKFLGESLDGLPFAAFIVAPDGHLVVANRPAIELCSLDKVSLPFRTISAALEQILPSGMNWMQAMEEAQGGKHVELNAIAANGSEYEFSIASFRNDAGVISGVIVVAKDVTELHRAQREREDALSFLSHDIRSPQNSIIALAELQRHEQSKKPVEEFINAVETLAQRTMTLAEDFLQLVRADSKPLNLEECDMLDLVQDCMAEIEPQARAKNVSIRLSDNYDQSAVLVDRSLLARAIGNLLTNAVKYSPPGGEVDVRCVTADGNVVCSFTDQGSGIDAEDIPKLFRRFSRLQTRDSNTSGAGLGLAFVDVVMRRHGGCVRADSAKGVMTRFEMTLPKLKIARQG